MKRLKIPRGTKKKIKQNMRKISFEGVTGKIEFDENENIKEKPFFIKTIKNSQLCLTINKSEKV